MNQKIKLWINALRSGEYKKGTRYLKTGNYFTASGVLVDLFLKEHNLQWQTKEDIDWYKVASSCKDNSSINRIQEIIPFYQRRIIIPTEVSVWAQVCPVPRLYQWYTEKRRLDDGTPEPYSYSRVVTLTELNQDTRVSFRDIANMIEETFAKETNTASITNSFLDIKEQVYEMSLFNYLEAQYRLNFFIRD